MQKSLEGLKVSRFTVSGLLSPEAYENLKLWNLRNRSYHPANWECAQDDLSNWPLGERGNPSPQIQEGNTEENKDIEE
jgi:hypothetical protein